MFETRRAVAVTGAGSGIGKAIADLLEDHGTRVIRLGRGRQAGVQTFDVSNETDWNQLAHDDITGLVHAAGIRKRNPLAQTTVEDFRAVIDVNVTGTFLALRWAARRPDTAPLTSVVTLSSAAVERLPEDQLAYNSSKAAINALTRGAAKELAPRGIRVNSIAPGSILTPMTEAGWSDTAHAARMRAEIPAGRPGTAVEVAHIAEFLLSEKSAYMTGSLLTADGGWSL